MTLNLAFVGANATQATLAQFTAEVGVGFRLVAQRITQMEIFPVSVVTVEFDTDSAEVPRWFAARGIHRLAS
ncbi:hypothetical protein [Enemella sp. A6]|uniref:hypothetical protein n=1 Tax=Enemella sp. A6 TaxID=3440152 RepID=UPI003EC133C3